MLADVLSECCVADKDPHVDVPRLRYDVDGDCVTTHVSPEDVAKDVYAQKTRLGLFSEGFRKFPRDTPANWTRDSLYRYVGEKERAYEPFWVARDVDGWSATLTLRYALSLPSLLYRSFSRRDSVSGSKST